MYPANICLDEDVLKTSFVFVFSRRLQDVFKTNMFALALRLQKTPSKRLQDVLVNTNIFVLTIRLQDAFKTFSRGFKTSSRRLPETSSRHLQNVLKTSSKRLQDALKNVFKTSSRSLQDILQRYLHEGFKTYHQVKLFLLTRL